MFRKKKKTKQKLRHFYRVLIVISNLLAAGAASIIIGVLFLVPSLPDIETIKTLELKIPLRIYSSDGLLIGEYGSERRVPVRIADAPSKLIAAVLSAEDDRYYEHVGIDYQGIIRAVLVNVQTGARSQGASTITMQVARNYFLTREQSYTRKAREALLALRLEQLLTKDQILELYLNKIFLGHRAYGFGAAATTYYGKPLSELNVAQFAMLAALPKAPSTVNPISNPAKAVNRRNYILDRMHKLGYISDSEFSDAVKSPLTASIYTSVVELKAPYVAEFVRQEIVSKFGEQAYEDGFSVYTTIHSRDQIAATKSLREGLMRYDRRHGYRGPVKNVNLSEISNLEAQLNVLKEVDFSQDVIPALVNSVQKDKVVALNYYGDQVTIDWQQIKWAVPHINSRAVGAKPKSPLDVLSVGDAIHIRQVPVDDADNEEDAQADDASLETEAIVEPQWMLAQIPEVQGALISIRPQDGAIKAMTGGFDYYLGKFNRATQAQRQIGSSIKPFVYSAALQEGFTASTLVSGAPIVIEDESTAVVWKPENYSGKFFGPTRLRRALEKSVNLVSIRLIRGIGSGKTIDHLTKFGMERESLPTGLSLALGSAQMTPLQVVRGYSVFANGGYEVVPYIIDVVKDRYGVVVARGQSTKVCTICLDLHEDPEANADSPLVPVVKNAKRVIPVENAYIMYDMLHQVVLSGTARKANSLNRNDLAGKTGTTNDFEDAWFSGFNRELATTVWVGFDEPSDLGRHEAGSRVALPIWIEYMKVALQDTPNSRLPKPDNVKLVHVHDETGEAVAPDHPQALPELFLVGTEPNTQHASLQPGSDHASTAPTSQQVADELF